MTFGPSTIAARVPMTVSTVRTSLRCCSRRHWWAVELWPERPLGVRLRPRSIALTDKERP